MSEMLPLLVGKRVALNITHGADLPLINADAGMIEQVLMNLAVNARDAMPNGGQLSIRAEETEIAPGAARPSQQARPGRFLCLSVSDTGCGIPPEILPRIFEPFFTTKGAGQGTGLGLATVAGIVQQHAGWIEVESQPGRGCTFRVFIPVHEKAAEAPSPLLPTQPSTRGHETILVVEPAKPLPEPVVT
jgi:two-component system, cell cycle sensor histidine kinase and response regulator CckA